MLIPILDDEDVTLSPSLKMLRERRLRRERRPLDGEGGGLGVGKGTSVPVDDPWNTERLGCCSKTLVMTSGPELPTLSSTLSSAGVAGRLSTWRMLDHIVVDFAVDVGACQAE